MARDPKTKKISCFIVETGWPGVKVEHRCRFMGLKALANGVVSFQDVHVPRENLVGEEGKGLKIALITLNTGRLTLPATCTGLAKRCLEICRGWANERKQWGIPIGQARGDRASPRGDGGDDVRDGVGLEAGERDGGSRRLRHPPRGGGREGVEHGPRVGDRRHDAPDPRRPRATRPERSLEGRGEFPVPVERLMRDARINLIFEGSSEIMHLFMAREAVDKHLEVAGAMIDPKNKSGDKLAALPKILGYYAGWYPPLWLRGVGARRALRRLGAARPAPPLRRAERAEARARELPRHVGLPGEDGTEAGLPLPLRRRRDGALRDVGDDRARRAAWRTTAIRPPTRRRGWPISSAACRAGRCAASSATSGATRTRGETRWRARCCAAITRGSSAASWTSGSTPESFKTQSLLALRAKERAGGAS
jgi:hypothetical protein